MYTVFPEKQERHTEKVELLRMRKIRGLKNVSFRIL